MTATFNSIAVLDDHMLITEAIGKIVADNPDYTFAGGFNQLSALQQHIQLNGHPAYLLLDVNLGTEDGMLICKQLMKLYPALKIIMLTGLTQPAIVKNAIRNGAVGFMPKNMAREDLWNCLENIKAGGTWLHKDIQQIMIQNSLDGRQNTQEYIPKLSRREKEVLGLIIKEMTTQEIASALFISVNTVETHRSSLLLKLGAKNSAGLVKITIEKGLLDVD